MGSRVLQHVRRVIVGGLAAAAVSVSVGAQAPAPETAPAASEPIPILRDVGIDQKLDAAVPLETPFVDERGRDVTLGEYFGVRPVVLVLAYYQCPMLCSQVQSALAGAMKALPFNAGREFAVVVVSFNPGDTPPMAVEKRNRFIENYGRPGTDAGVHFLTGRQSSIEALTRAVGFRYVYDAKIDQYAHPAAITILTTNGRVSRYLFGIDFAPRELRLALVEASDNRIGTAVDQALLYCYHYDPASGRYGLAITNIVRLGGLLTLGALAAFIITSVRRERRHHSAGTTTATDTR